MDAVLNPGHAQLARRNGRSGYYAVNRETDIAVAGPFADYTEAQRECGRRNRIPPVTPNLCEVRLVGPSKVPDF